MYHSNTRIYQEALELVDDAQKVVKGLPRGYAFLKDQLLRASSSVALNYIEGCGRSTEKDRRNFFDMARGSAYEVHGIMDVALRLKVVKPQLAQRAKARCDQLSAMLTKYS